jgi:hypothetical protein
MRCIVLAIVVAGLLGLAPLVHAFTIDITPGAGLAGNADALGAFNRAADQWENLFIDPIIVTINADLIPLGPGVLGSSSSVMLAGSHNTIRDQMVADAADEPSDAIVASLPTAAQFTALLPGSFGLLGMSGTKANLKAMGFSGLDAAFGITDATVNFSSAFAFDFDNSNGVTAGQHDFETVAAHELGHALGFVSEVDYVDFLLHQQQTGNVYPTPLDLFRFGPDANPSTVAQFTNNPRDLRPGVNSYFDDLSNEWSFSTGVFTGDGRQASHWKDDAFVPWIGIMDPTLASGVLFPIAEPDILSLDLVGYDRATSSVPEPATLLLVGFGLLGLSVLRKK